MKRSSQRKKSITILGLSSSLLLIATLLPAAIVLLFGLALFAVSARIWLPGDMAAPAPIS